ncbi:MAG: cupin domain-containing protein [Bacteroidales bacterium]|nr:cupin domain-containing protein [Bacteroidales bacterium]
MSDLGFKKEEATNLSKSIDYNSNAIVSKTIIKKETGNITLFSFDEGQQLSKHTAPFDAVVQILDGEAEIIIGETKHLVRTGEMIIMPANIPHVVNAVKHFKMLLTMIKS